MTIAPKTRYLMPQFDVTVVEDVTFTSLRNNKGERENLKLDLYLPTEDPLPVRPAVVWVHGGGFRPGNDKQQVYIPMFAEAFASRGYVGIAPDYRVREDPRVDITGTIEDAVADLSSALAWIREHGPTYKIDPKRLALAGGSAGGMTVLNLCHHNNLTVTEACDSVRAIVDLWGTPSGDTRLFERVNPASPPTLIIHGTADTLVRYDASLALAEELKAAGAEPAVLTLFDAPHTPLDHFEQIVESVTGFLYRHVEH